MRALYVLAWLLTNCKPPRRPGAIGGVALRARRTLADVRNERQVTECSR